MTCACATARQLARTLTQLYDRHLRTAGMETPQFTILMMLDQAGPLSQVDLGRLQSMDKTTVSRNVRVLEKYGWIREVSSNDRRKRQFGLSSDGKKRLSAAKPAWEKAQRELRSGMTAEQWPAMFETFGAVTAAARMLQLQDQRAKGA
jgi:DNA-binding MarR family transcriptional regulator